MHPKKTPLNGVSKEATLIPPQVSKHSLTCTAGSG